MIILVSCAYCGTANETPDPPALVKCRECGRSFRVLRNESGCKHPIEIGDAAREFYERKRGAK